MHDIEKSNLLDKLIHNIKDRSVGVIDKWYKMSIEDRDNFRQQFPNLYKKFRKLDELDNKVMENLIERYNRLNL